MNKKNPYRTKMKPDELREYLAFKRKQGCVPAKKGKGSYNRKKLNNEKEWQEMMTTGDLAKYLQYANPNIEVVLLDREKYERLLRKAKAFDKICNQIEDIHYEVMKAKD